MVRGVCLRKIKKLSVAKVQLDNVWNIMCHIFFINDFN